MKRVIWILMIGVLIFLCLYVGYHQALYMERRASQPNLSRAPGQSSL